MPRPGTYLATCAIDSEMGCHESEILYSESVFIIPDVPDFVTLRLLVVSHQFMPSITASCLMLESFTSVGMAV